MKAIKGNDAAGCWSAAKMTPQKSEWAIYAYKKQKHVFYKINLVMDIKL